MVGPKKDSTTKTFFPLTAVIFSMKRKYIVAIAFKYLLDLDEIIKMLGSHFPKCMYKSMKVICNMSVCVAQVFVDHRLHLSLQCDAAAQKCGFALHQ